MGMAEWLLKQELDSQNGGRFFPISYVWGPVSQLIWYKITSLGLDYAARRNQHLDVPGS